MEASLDELGIVSGTDKSSLRQDYLRHYERLLAPFVGAPITLLEIGVGDGSSLETWKRYLAAATIVGIDIDPGCKRFETDRTVVHIGSQTDAAFLHSVALAHPPTVIIDDGSHLPDHMIASFCHLFPFVTPGGCYIVEDFDVVFGPYRVDDPNPSGAVHFFGELHKALMSRWKYTPQGSPELNYEVLRTIDRIETFENAVAIWRKAPAVVAPRARIEELVARSTRPLGWLYFADYLARGGDVHGALSAINEGITRTPNDAWPHSFASQLYEMAGDVPAAVTSAERAVGLAPGEPYFARELARLRAAQE